MEALDGIAEELKNKNPEPVATPEPVVEAEPVQPTPPVEPVAQVAEPVEKPWYEAEQNQPEPVAPASQPDPKYKEYESLFEDPDIQMVVKAKKAGKNLHDFVMEYKVEDISKLSDEALYEKGLRELYGATEEQIESEIQAFSEMSVIAKATQLRAIRSEFDQRNQSKLKELSTGYETQAQTAKLIGDKLHSDFEKFSTEIVGKEMFGLAITEQISKKGKETVLSGAFQQKLLNPDGTYNVGKLFEFYLWDEYGKDIVKVNISKAKSEGAAEVLEAVTNPSQNRVSQQSNAGSGDISEALDDYLNSKQK